MGGVTVRDVEVSHLWFFVGCQPASQEVRKSVSSVGKMERGIKMKWTMVEFGN